MALPCIYSALQSNIVQLPFDSNELCMSFTDVSHVPGGSFGALFSYQSHLSRPTNARITRVYSFVLHAPSPSHVSSFGAVCLNNNHWNATLSHSEVSFKARHNPPPIPTLTFSHAKMEWSNFLLVAHFLGSFEPIKKKILQPFWTEITFAESFEGVFSPLCSHLFFGGQVLYILKRCDEVGAACVGLQLGMAGIVECLDRLQSAFWSC